MILGVGAKVKVRKSLTEDIYGEVGQIGVLNSYRIKLSDGNFINATEIELIPKKRGKK